MYLLSLVVLEDIEHNLMIYVLKAVEYELLIQMLVVLTGDLEFAVIKPRKGNYCLLLYSESKKKIKWN